LKEALRIATVSNVETSMNREYTAITKQIGEWRVGWIEEIPGVNCQERTHEELLKSLRITLIEALQFNHEEASSRRVG
jgi:hypothetical protein